MVAFQQAGTAGYSWCFSKSFYLQLPSVVGFREEYQVSLDFMCWRRDRIPNDKKLKPPPPKEEKYRKWKRKEEEYQDKTETVQMQRSFRRGYVNDVF